MVLRLAGSRLSLVLNQFETLVGVELEQSISRNKRQLFCDSVRDDDVIRRVCCSENEDIRVNEVAHQRKSFESLTTTLPLSLIAASQVLLNTFCKLF